MLSKSCAKCGIDKPTSEFVLRNAGTGATRSECKACQSIARAARKEKTTAYNKAYHEANREEMSKRNREYHEKNRDRLNTLCLKRNMGRYYSDTAYQTRVLSDGAASRAPSKNFVPSWADMASIESIYAYAASLRATGLVVEVDHIVPIKSKLVCGLHVHENLQVLTKTDNAKKKNMRWPTDMPYAETPYKLPI